MTKKDCSSSFVSFCFPFISTIYTSAPPNASLAAPSSTPSSAPLNASLVAPTYAPLSGGGSSSSTVQIVPDHIDMTDKETAHLDDIISHITQLLELIKVIMNIDARISFLSSISQGDLVTSLQDLIGHC